MKDIKIPNGYFQLWHTYIHHQVMVDDIYPRLDQDELHQLKMILALPMTGQSSYGFFLKLITFTQSIAPANFIFEMARSVKPEHFGVLGYMASRSGSVAEALNYILRFSRLVIDGDEIVPMQMHQHGQFLLLNWPFISEQFNLINEITNAMMIQLARQILPHDQFPLHKVFLAHDALISTYHYQKFYACEVVFNHDNYGLMIQIDSLELKPHQADPSLIQLLVQQAEDAIASKPRQASIDQKIHLIVAEYLRLKQDVPKIEDLADELYLSVRTLQRQLKSVNSSFKQIVEIERMKRCEKLLTDQISLSEIALQLGYSDQSALARAYKKFKGQTLLQRKKEMLDNQRE